MIGLDRIKSLKGDPLIEKPNEENAI